MMFGRRGIKRARDEAELNPYRQRFCEMFQRLEREHGVKHYLAHNMTVTPRNVGQVAEVVRDCRDMGFRMFSFQPAAFIGNDNRWKDDYDEMTSGDGVGGGRARRGARLPCHAFQIGDERCNRTAYGAYVGDRYIPLLDDRVPQDLRVRDAFYATVGAMDFTAPLLVPRLARAFARRPGLVPLAVRWAGRFARRAGGWRRLLRHRPRAVTFVMHSFMDARDVRPAWELLQRGETSEDPRVRATQERLQACSYAMAHPESDTLVPACAQHSVLDPEENLELTELLPVAPVALATTPSRPARGTMCRSGRGRRLQQRRWRRHAERRGVLGLRRQRQLLTLAAATTPWTRATSRPASGRTRSTAGRASTRSTTRSAR